tara:strand:- start:415 stop:741 length:327 start_codon:yes stop_codon:yes gene_type:complete
MLLLALPDDVLRSVVPLTHAILFAQVCRAARGLRCAAAVENPTPGGQCNLNLSRVVSQRLVHVHSLHMSYSGLTARHARVLAQHGGFCVKTSTRFWRRNSRCCFVFFV